MAATRGLVSEGLPLVLGVVGTEQLSAHLSQEKAGTSFPWVRQIQPTDDIPSLYRAAAVFLAPSRNEGFNYSVCEAMANGTPVVFADIPGMAWARSCPGAVFCRAGDADSLREAIRSVLAWPAAQREDRAQKSSRYVHENFDVRHWAEEVATFYWGPPGRSEQDLQILNRRVPQTDERQIPEK